MTMLDDEAKSELVLADAGGWISGPCLEIPPVEALADEIVLEIRKILSAYRADQMDAENARMLMRKNVISVVMGDAGL